MACLLTLSELLSAVREKAKVSSGALEYDQSREKDLLLYDGCNPGFLENLANTLHFLAEMNTRCNEMPTIFIPFLTSYNYWSD